GILFGIITSIYVNTLVMGLLSVIIAFILALVCLPVPRLTTGSVLYTFALVYKIAIEAEADVPLSMILAGSLILTGAIPAVFLWLMFSKKIYKTIKTGLFTLMIGGMVVLFFSLAGQSNVKVTTGQKNPGYTDPPFADP